MKDEHMTDDEGGFDWTDAVVPQQYAIAVYLNGSCDIVIRRQADWPHENDDVCIVIGRHHVRDVIEALERALRETSPPTGAKEC